MGGLAQGDGGACGCACRGSGFRDSLPWHLGWTRWFVQSGIDRRAVWPTGYYDSSTRAWRNNCSMRLPPGEAQRWWLDVAVGSGKIS
ncbi:MAG: hypothetical protein U0703_08240 [Anaerolineae bacterium]